MIMPRPLQIAFWLVMLLTSISAYKWINSFFHFLPVLSSNVEGNKLVLVIILLMSLALMFLDLLFAVSWRFAKNWGRMLYVLWHLSIQFLSVWVSYSVFGKLTKLVSFENIDLLFFFPVAVCLFLPVSNRFFAKKPQS